jgi:hypothetical protein
MERLISILAVNRNDEGLQRQAKRFMLPTKCVHTAGQLNEFFRNFNMTNSLLAEYF